MLRLCRTGRRCPTPNGGTTHYLDEAEEFADRVVLMRSGLVIADGSVAEVRSAVSGRTLTAQVPGATVPAMLALPGVRKADVRGRRTELDCEDSDAALRALLTGFPEAHDIEIRALGLEEAFLALTGDTALTGETGEATR